MADAMRLLAGSPAVLESMLGWRVPTEPNRATQSAGGLCLWLAPDQWLLFGAPLVQHRGSTAIVDVSARWMRFDVSVDTLAAGCGLDLRERAFAVGGCAQTRIEQVPAILHRRSAMHFDVLVERPLAHYFQMWLEESWQEPKASP